ncbi:MAG: integrase domain-containing protein [Rhodocyclaceae bacterium]|nr:integrase domain-containing protein [Rhodocyclaceae bacterium]
MAKPQYKNFAVLLKEILSENLSQSASKKRNISYATIEKRQDIIWNAFKELKELGVKLKTPRSFANRHLTRLAKAWEAKGLSAATIQNRISVMRIFAEWIGKKGMVLAAENYVEDKETVKRVYIADHDKSWTAVNINPEKIIEEIAHEDPYVAHQLKAIYAFGLRRKEAVMLRPNVADRGTYLSVSDGAKGGRYRSVPIDSEFKRQVVDELKKFARGNPGHLGNPNRDLEGNLQRITYMMVKYKITKKDTGVTLHGLRHQYLNDRFEEIAGTPPPVRGGVLTKENEEATLKAMAICAEDAGHTRISITGAYYGSLRRESSKKTEPA